jgi:integrase
MNKAIGLWGNRNIKEIGYAEIENFLFQNLRELSAKSKSNAASTLHAFWNWLRKRRVLNSSQLPEVPEVSFELEYRNTTDKQTQERILDELRSNSWDVNHRVWIALKWLSTYISIRPWELVSIKEGEINREQGLLIIPHPKEKKPKVVPLTDDDAELVRSQPRSFPELYFFRHLKGHGGATPGERFGPRYLYRWWKRACSNLGIEGIDLYGGTRHSTAIYLGQFFTPEQLKQATMHATNKAFERYFQTSPQAIKSVYEVAGQGGNKGETKITHTRKMPSPIQQASMWWRRRELNPRPKAFHLSLYMLIPYFACHPERLLRAGSRQG